MVSDDRQKKIGELLIDRGLITQKQLDEALEFQKISGEFLGQILIRMRLITEEDLMNVLSKQFNMPFMELKYRYVDVNLLKKFSPSLILDYKCFPIKKDDWSLTVAITNPLDVWSIKRAEQEAGGLRLKLVLVTNSDMEEAIERYRQYIRGGISKT